MENAGQRLAQAINNYRGFDPAQAAEQAAREARIDAPPTGPDGRPATTTAASMDPTMPLKPGNPYNTQIGYSGEVPAGTVGLPGPVAERLPVESWEHWSVDNCAEVASVSRVVTAGSSIDDVITRTVRTGNGNVWPACENCSRWLPNR